MTTDTTVSLKCLKNFFIVPTLSLNEVEKNLKDINKQLDALTAMSQRPHFPFENTPEQIEAEWERLQEKKLAIEKEKTHLLMASKGYPEELDYTPLGWIKKDSLLPALFIINIKDAAVRLVVDYRSKSVDSFKLVGEHKIWYRSVERQYPEAIVRLYEEAAKRIASGYNSSWERETVATAKFQGILPATTREKINQAIKSRLFDDIYIIAEAKDWSVKNVLIARTDPYVVGWVNKTKQMFIIDFFDPTPLETYIKEQHTI